MTLNINPGISIGPGIVLTSDFLPDGLTQQTAGTSAWQIKRDHPASADGLYWIKNNNINGGNPVQIYADMTTDSGGWTLIMQNVYPDWTYENSLQRNEFSPPATLAPTGGVQDPNQNYSIIGWANYIKKSPSGFDYMIEAYDRNSYGGIWTANSAYSFVEQVDTNAYGTQGASYFGSDAVSGSNGFHQDITLKTKFGDWNYNDSGIEHRMPWYTYSIANTAGNAIITTTHDDGNSWWGTLMAFGAQFQPAPWIADSIQNPGVIWYWVR